MLEENRGMIEFVEACPKIPYDRKKWGKLYKGKCTCGGTIYAYRSTRNGYYRAHCERCKWGMREN